IVRGELPARREPLDMYYRSLFYSGQAKTRTDAEGRFSLKPELAESPTALGVMSEMRLPYRVDVLPLKADEQHLVKVDDVPLFPAAKIAVTAQIDAQAKADPVFLARRDYNMVGVLSLWQVSASDQSEIAQKLRAAQQPGKRNFEPLFLLPDKADTAFMPSG